MPEVHEQLIDQVRAAFEPGASTATKQAAAQACRMMLSVLDPGAPAASSPSSAPAAGASAPDPLGAVLDGIIGRYKHLLPDDPTRPTTMPIPIIAIPPNLFPKG
jgi:hypothetical protein